VTGPPLRSNPKLRWTDAGQLVVLAMCPDVRRWVYFRRVGMQVLCIQPAFRIPDELMREFAFVSWKPIPDQQDVALD
jgi:hypothetical protein